MNNFERIRLWDIHVQIVAPRPRPYGCIFSLPNFEELSSEIERTKQEILIYKRKYWRKRWNDFVVCIKTRCGKSILQLFVRRFSQLTHVIQNQTQTGTSGLNTFKNISYLLNRPKKKWRCKSQQREVTYCDNTSITPFGHARAYTHPDSACLHNCYAINLWLPFCVKKTVMQT